MREVAVEARSVEGRQRRNQGRLARLREAAETRIVTSHRSPVTSRFRLGLSTF